MRRQGARGKGLCTSRSDYDVYLVIADGVDPAAIRLGVDYDDGVDLVGMWTLDAFADYAVADDYEWNRYNFAHLQPTVDKVGSLQDLCDAKEWLPGDKARASAEVLIGVYLNYRFRAVKNQADGNFEAAALDAAESAAGMLDFIFTAESRVRPYNKFLSWELDIHPLEHDWGIAMQPSTPVQLVRTADAALQAACFRGLEGVARRLHYGSVLDSWRPSELALMRSHAG